MRFQVQHQTAYTYSAPVSLGPQVIRLRPRDDGAQRLLAFALEIDPAPAALWHYLDAAGNVVARAEFAGTTTRLRVATRFEAETLPSDPYRLDPAFGALPARYDAPQAALLAPYFGADAHPAVEAFAAAVAADVDHEPLAFLHALTDALIGRIDRQVRPDGAAQSAAQTLAIGRGACRDLTVLFMESARALGLATRFVSGYQDRSSIPHPQRHLHAWPEVFVPGGGWRGFDPTRGAVVGETHVALCAAPAQEGTMPLEGSFYADPGTRSKLDFNVDIEVD